MKAKFDGRDPDPGYRMDVSEQVGYVHMLLLFLFQVKFIIEEATSPDNLCQLYGMQELLIMTAPLHSALP